YAGLIKLLANGGYRDGVAELPIQDCPRGTELKAERSLRRNRRRHRSPGAAGSIGRDNSSGQSAAIRHSIEMSDQWSPPEWARRRDYGVVRKRTGRRGWRCCRGRDRRSLDCLEQIGRGRIRPIVIAVARLQ